MMNETRRGFLKSAAASGAAMFAAPMIAQGRASANGRTRVAVVGLRGRGKDHIATMQELAGENVELAALCDCDANVLEAAAGAHERIAGKKVARFDDMRKLFDDKSIDAVTFATPNHWHVLGAVWACQAGKDVYVEKPCSQYLADGRKLVEAARKYQRIVQHGTQCRSSQNIREGVARLHEGIIGRLYMARVVNYKHHLSPLGTNKAAPMPKGLNWDMWVGPAAMVEFSPFIWRRYNWLWNFGVGDIGNQGVHNLDLVRWGLQIDTHPTKIQAMGGNLFYPEDEIQCPCTQVAAYTFGDKKILVTCETRDGLTNSEAGFGIEYPFVDHRNVVGVIFYGTKGYMIFPDYSSYYTFLGPKREPGPSKMVPGNPISNTEHFRNWIQAVRDRDAKQLNAEIGEGHLSAALCHLANIAYRVGRTVNFDPQQEKFVADEEANTLLARGQRREPYVLPEKV